MKIKFIKDYVSVDPATNSGIIHRFGEIEEITEYTAQWLIDNGFAEETKESDWKPEKNCDYYYVRDNMSMISTTGYEYVGRQQWTNSEDGLYRYSIGNVFKTLDAAERYHGYLEAVETVRHDEGFMKKGNDRFVYPIVVHNNLGAVSAASSSRQHAGEFYFDSYEHSNASLDKHRDEWVTILNYDWSRE